jgi:hypothetical protein
MAQLPNARGRLIASRGRAVLAARCPLCGGEHRYDKGPIGDPALDDLQDLGFSEEWMPCQLDLPGNFWRITFGRERRRKPSPRGDGPPSTPSNAGTAS